MLGKFWQQVGKSTAIFGLCSTLSLSLLGCSQADSGQKAEAPAMLAIAPTSQLEEVSPPLSLQQLQLELNQYRPQVEIQGVSANETLEDTKLSIRVRVKDYPIYKDQKLGLGPHINIFLDNQHYQDIYDQGEPLEFSNLSPGTHTIRAVAVRPWEESYKTPGAYDQVSFQVFAPTQSAQPDPTQPVLTFSSPQAESTSEPILLDYLITPPSFKSARTDLEEPRQVRVSLQGTSFTTHEESPIYLKGLKPGVNWIKLELLDRSGKPVLTPLSEVLKVVTVIEAGANAGTDSLARLFRGDLTDQDARRTVSQSLSKQLTEAETKAQKAQAQAAKEAAVSRQLIEREHDKRPEEAIAPKLRRSVEADEAKTKQSQQNLKPASSEKSFEKSLEKSLKESKDNVTENLPSAPGGSAAVGPNLVFDNASEKPTEPVSLPSQAPTEDKVPLWSKLKSRLSSAQEKPVKAYTAQPKPERSARRGSPEPSTSSIPATLESQPDLLPRVENRSVQTQVKQAELNNSKPAMAPEASGAAASLQKFLDFQPIDPENLPIIRQKTLRILGSDEVEAQKTAKAD